jgi:two-component system alkaline phosphatase synthesis response regulator PhoP
MKRVFIIEDQKDIVRIVKYNLEREGFKVTSASDGNIGLAELSKSLPDLLILDLMLPTLPGLEVCKKIRLDQKLNRLPILILTARGDEADRVLGLELGADDYVTKPFSPRELVARVKALLRRAPLPGEPGKTIEVAGLLIDPDTYRLTRAGRRVPLGRLEFRLLYFLASHPNKIFSRDQLLDAVWKGDRFVTPRNIDVYIRHLRKKIEPDPTNPVYLKTVRGVGYLLETQET